MTILTDLSCNDNVTLDPAQQVRHCSISYFQKDNFKRAVKMRKMQLCSAVLQFMETIDPGNESQSKVKVRISYGYMEIDSNISH